VDKAAFDCMAERGFCERLEETGRRTVVIAGIEAHICVTQTALSLVRAGYHPYVVADAVCSRRPTDREIALARLRSAGVVVTTSESVLYEALERAGTTAFREVLQLVKECRPTR
jgi:nicotinamidase-related amidase